MGTSPLSLKLEVPSICTANPAACSIGKGHSSQETYSIFNDIMPYITGRGRDQRVFQGETMPTGFISIAFPSFSVQRAPGLS
jgi:hypothetical protein